MARSREEESAALKRKVRALARIEGDPIMLAEGFHVVRIRKIRSGENVLETLRKKGALTISSFSRDVEAEAPPVAIDLDVLHEARRDLAALSTREALARIKENRRKLVRYGDVDERWLRTKRVLLDRLATIRLPAPNPEAWFEALVALIRIFRGDNDAELLAGAGKTIATRAARTPKTAKARREDELAGVAALSLAYRCFPDDLPLLSATELAAMKEKNASPLTFAKEPITAYQAVTLCQKEKVLPGHRNAFARWLGQGLEPELLYRTVDAGHGQSLSEVNDVRAARAYATWASRLVPHYASFGVDFALSPELFANLPRNEDLAVLAMCLIEQGDPRAKKIDPIAVLDATLGLFGRLPAKAKGLMKRLRGTSAGLGKKTVPEFAEWLGDDPLLDRLLHVQRLAGETPSLSKRIREDFDRSAKTRREVAHLEKLPVRKKPQEDKLALLLRTSEDGPRDRTKKRIEERIDALLGGAYRRELDAVFREILRDAYGIAAPTLTPAWRDAVRFWLTVDDNRTMLGRLLKEAASSPGRGIWEVVPKSRAWIETMRGKIDVDAWLAPRKKKIGVYTIEMEEDPLEILRMGIPFGTCLSLEDGCNAASTVVNATEANKRVLYVRSATGSIVGRKLLAITKDLKLVGYKVYVAAFDEEKAIRAAVNEFCLELAAKVGVTPVASGRPELLHDKAFWYDDGSVPFEDDTDLSAYALSLGLPPLTTWYEGAADEARGYLAMEKGSVDEAIALLHHWRWGRANERLGRFVVGRLGETRAARKARSHPGVFLALGQILVERGVPGCVRFLEIAAQADENTSLHRIVPFLAWFPRHKRIARAVVETANRYHKRYPRAGDQSVAHVLMNQLSGEIVDVEGGLALLDLAMPTWDAIAKRDKRCVTCRKRAIDLCAWAVLIAHERSPEPDAVIACLTDRRRSEAAHDAALRVATWRALPDGLRALDRLAKIRPDLADSGEMNVARMRQKGKAAPVPYDQILAGDVGPRAFPSLAPGHATWTYVLGRVTEQVEIARMILEKMIVHGFHLDARDTAVVYQNEALRRPLLVAFLRNARQFWAARSVAVERAAESMGISADGFLEDVARLLSEDAGGASMAATGTDTIDQARSIANLVVREVEPANAIHFAAELNDLLSFSIFYRALAKAPRDRIAALRDAANRHSDTEDDWLVRRDWILGKGSSTEVLWPTSPDSKERRPTSRTTRSKLR